MFDRVLPHLPIPAAYRPLVEQIIRYVVVGGFVTALGAGTYYVCVRTIDFSPLVSGVLGYLVSAAIGYVLHSRISFAGHGEGGRDAVRSARFFVVSLISLGLNELWIWIITGLLHLDERWPIPAMVFLTPVIVFILNRKWVFA